MQNNFPRIYSLSTIGIKQHFNADYLFHPYRTDFSGESGSGKSMIADMIQLVLVGSSEFESATVGNKDRDVKGMLISKKGNSSTRGYIFLNVEISPKKYIVVGVYIEGTSNAAEMFIIQNGYDWDNLTPLDKPVFYKDFIINNKVETLKNLCDKVDFARMKSFRRKNYHQILYNSDILSLDLTKGETLRTFASILRSFSRGKGFKTESENLKKFLFGDDEQNAIMAKYNEEVNNISNDFHEHKRYSEEIELINEKQLLLQTVLDKQKKYKAIYTEYLTKKFNYWNGFKKKETKLKLELVETLKTKKNELQYVENNILKLKIADLNEFLAIKEKIEKLNKKDSSDDNIETQFVNIGQSKIRIEVAEQWLNSFDNDLEKANTWFTTQNAAFENKLTLKEFIKYLDDNKVLNVFESSKWLSNFKEENDAYSEKIQGLEKQITELKSLSKFSNLNNPESLVGWAMDNLKFPVSHTTESVLVYFQKYGKIKPNEENSKRYVPYPKQLFEDIDSNIKDKSKLGFWLNLDGVYEFISYSEDRVLNVVNPEAITESISEFKEGIEKKLYKVIAEKDKEEHLRKILFEYSNLKKNIELYKRKEEITTFEIDKRLIGINKDAYNLHIQEYQNKTIILEQYNKLHTEFEEFTSRKNIVEGYQKRIKQLTDTYFDEVPSINVKSLQSNIEAEKQLLKEQETKLKEKDFNEDAFLYLHKKEISNQIKVNELKHIISDVIKDLKAKIEQKDKQLDLAADEIEQAKDLNEELFNSSILFNEKDTESSNPDDGGNNSLQKKANVQKLGYTEYLKLITKDLPYDETASIGQLANYLLPTVFPSVKVDEDLISNDIVDRLNKLTLDIQEIGSRKVDIIGSVFNDVYNVYRGYLTKINDINSYLKKDNKEITGGNKASLTFKKSIHYPENWLSTFRKQLQNQMNYTGLFSDLRDEIDINKMMVRAFQKLGGSTKVDPEDLMNPTSYFDLVFELKLENEDANSGSNGQTYAANALLCLARLSLIEEDGKDGLKIMPIDEAEGLGSNYDMLHELAKKEEYQIITMAIETAGEITDNGQYIYIMNENNLANVDSFVPPLGIFSDDVTEDIEEYIKSISEDE